jgi:hypothetical protein
MRLSSALLTRVIFSGLRIDEAKRLLEDEDRAADEIAALRL